MEERMARAASHARKGSSRQAVEAYATAEPANAEHGDIFKGRFKDPMEKNASTTSPKPAHTEKNVARSISDAKRAKAVDRNEAL
eukprot:81219-Karenia_brevis.AAC.1